MYKRQASLKELAVADCEEKPHRANKWVKILTAKGLYKEAVGAVQAALTVVSADKEHAQLKQWLEVLNSALKLEVGVSEGKPVEEKIENYRRIESDYRKLKMEVDNGPILPLFL